MPALISDWANPIHRDGTSGEAVVLIHGFSGHPGHWLPMAEALTARGHTVVAPRLPGHGTTPADLATATAEQWLAATLEAAQSVRDHARIHLVGLSMGGMLAILAARPTAAHSLVTINAPVRTQDRKVALAPLLRRLVPETMAEPALSPDPALDYLWSPYPTHPTAAVVELVRVVRRGWKEAKRLRRPSLVVQSRTDETVLPSSGSRLARRLRARILWLDDCRHNALLDPCRPLVHQATIDHIEGSFTPERTGGEAVARGA